MRFRCCAVSPPLSVRTSPLASAVLLGYQRPFCMGRPEVNELEVASKIVVLRIPSPIVPLCPPATSIRPSGRNECPLQNRSAGSGVDEKVPLEPSVAGGVQICGWLLRCPQVNTFPVGRRLAWIARAGQSIGADHCPAPAIGDVR